MIIMLQPHKILNELHARKDNEHEPSRIEKIKLPKKAGKRKALPRQRLRGAHHSYLKAEFGSRNETALGGRKNVKRQTAKEIGLPSASINKEKAFLEERESTKNGNRAEETITVRKDVTLASTGSVGAINSREGKYTPSFPFPVELNL